MELSGSTAAVGVVVIVVVAIAAVVATRVRSERSGPSSKTIVLAEVGDVWLGRVALGLSGLSGHRVEFTSATSFELFWLRRPAWTIVVAVLFFPFGLVALLVTDTLVGSFREVDAGHPTRNEVSGDFSQVAVELVNRAIPD